MTTDQKANWHGISDNEHRTVGPNRAWCYTDAEWCYPVWRAEDGSLSEAMLCYCCDQHALPKALRGMQPGELIAFYLEKADLLDSHINANDEREYVLLRDVLDLIRTGGVGV